MPLAEKATPRSVAKIDWSKYPDIREAFEAVKHYPTRFHGEDRPDHRRLTPSLPTQAQIRNELRISPTDVLNLPLVYQQEEAIQKLSEYRSYIHRANELVPVMGAALTAIKSQMKHGEWLDWLKNKFEASERTAQVYMQVWEYWPQIQAAGIDQKPGCTLRELRAYAIQSQKAVRMIDRLLVDQDDNQRKRPDGKTKAKDLELNVPADNKAPLDLSIQKERFRTWNEDMKAIRQARGVEAGCEGELVADIIHETAQKYRETAKGVSL